MGLISKMRRQTAVYWPVVGHTGNGKPVHGKPVQIDCRWEDKAMEFVNPEGATVLSKSVIYVDREVTLGGVILLGELGSLTGDPASPGGYPEAQIIRQRGKLPDFKNKEVLLTVYT